jgi:RNA polymerase sigma-70 factor (ECF subfamily)
MQANGQGEGAGEVRPVTYCLVPHDLAPRLHERLRRHFADDASVEVVVERRTRERRAPSDRRRSRGGRDAQNARDAQGAQNAQDAGDAQPRTPDRRTIRSQSGRRAGDRRAPQVEAQARPLPRRAAAHAQRLLFVERLEPSGERAEDVDTARMVTRIQAGDSEVFALLYMRYFERVYGYIRALLRAQADAEDVTQQVFIDVMNGIGRYERRAQPFRAWLFAIARNHAVSHLKRHGRTTIMDPSRITRLQEHATNGQDEQELVAEVSALRWISDRDLHVFIERLPDVQREILMLRYMAGLSMSEIADMTKLSVMAVRKHHSRALSFLRQRLAAVGRDSTRSRRMGSRLLVKQSRVLRDRRFGLARPR